MKAKKCKWCKAPKEDHCPKCHSCPKDHYKDEDLDHGMVGFGAMFDVASVDRLFACGVIDLRTLNM